MAQQLFDLGGGLAVGFNPGGRHHGWLLRKHPDGQYVTVRKLELVADPYGQLSASERAANLKRAFAENDIPWPAHPAPGERTK